MATRRSRTNDNSGMIIEIARDEAIPAGKIARVVMEIKPSFTDEYLKHHVDARKRFVFLFDRSSSMSTGSKWPEVIKSIHFIRNVPESGNHDCVFFDHELLPCKIRDIRIDNFDPIDLTRAVIVANGHEIKPRGSTDIVQAMMDALISIIDTDGYRLMDTRVILLSDGEPYSSKNVNPSLNAFLGKKLDENAKLKIAGIMREIEKISSNFDNEQLRVFPGVFEPFSIPVHVLGIGMTKNFKELLNECINRSTGMNRSIEENKADKLLLVLDDDAARDDAAIFITNIVNARAMTIPSLKIRVQLENMAGIVSDIFDVARDDMVAVPKNVVGNDIVIDNEFTDVSMRDIPMLLYAIQLHDVPLGTLEMNMKISVNGIDFPVILELDVKDVTGEASKIMNKAMKIEKIKQIEELKSIIEECKSFPGGSTTIREIETMLETLKKRYNDFKKMHIARGG